MTEILLPGANPPVAPTTPHTWQRPTGAVDDPWAWLRDRDDPDDDRLPRGGERLRRRRTSPSRRRPRRRALRGDQVPVQETDESVPVRHGGWWYVTRTIEGESYPVFCRGRDAIDDATDVGDPRLQRRGRRPRVLRRPRRRPSPDHTLLAWSSDVDGGERYTLRGATSRPARTSRRDHRHVVVGGVGGRPTGSGCSTPAPTSRCARTRSGATASARRSATTCSCSRRPTSASSSTSRPPAASSGS